ncbi:MAG: hypothetical protein IJD45_00880 [Clostridia bacterium]|nr:hypothetical protein [Clostridia bacterium]
MQKGRVLSIKSYGIFEFLKNNSFLLTVTLIFTIGFFVGIFTHNNLSFLKSYSNDYIAEYILLRTSESFGTIFINSMFAFLSALFIFFILGASLFGVVTVPSALFIKGLLQGSITAFLYSSYSLKGIAFNAVIIIPPTLIFLIILILASRESVRFSIKFSSLTLPKTLPINLSVDFKDYTIKYLILALSTVVCALIDAIVSSGLIKHFTL